MADWQLLQGDLPVRQLRFKVRRVQHRIRSVEGQVTHVAIDVADPIHLRARFAIIMRKAAEGWRMDVPLTVYELLSRNRRRCSRERNPYHQPADGTAAAGASRSGSSSRSGPPEK